MNKIKKGDTVRVIAGSTEKGKGKEGKVQSVKNGKVLVEGINMVTKHAKPSAANQAGGLIEKEAPIDISNVMYLYKGATVRVGFQGEGKDKKRVVRVNGSSVAID